MLSIEINDFEGEYPKVGKTLLPFNAAQTADNCNMTGGTLKSWRKAKTTQLLTLAGTVGTVYLYRKGDGSERWCEWSQDVNVVPGPIPGDTTNRTYFTGTDVPRVFDDSMVDTGSGAYPRSSLKLKVPGSAAAPVATLGGGGSGTARDLVYTYVFVRKWASGKVDLSQPSPASNKVTALPGQTVTIDTFATPVAGCGITHIWIYRVSTGDYQYVTEIAVGTTSYNDSKLDSALGEALESTDWLVPPDDLFGLIELPGQMFAGISGNQVCVSVPGQVHAYPSRYRVPFSGKVVAIGHVGTAIVVTTENGFIHLIDVQNPDFLSTHKGSAEYRCLAKRGLVETDNGVLFPTHNGIALVAAGGQVGLFTEQHLAKEQWEAYYPSTIRAVSYRGYYIAFFNNTGAAGVANDGFLLNHNSPRGLAGLFGGVHCVHVDRQNGKLYYVATSDADSKNYVHEWDSEVDRVAYVWKSKKFIAPTLVNWGALQILADWDAALTQAEQDSYNAARNAIIAANQAALASDDSGSINGSAMNEVEVGGDNLSDVPPLLADIVGMMFKLWADGTLVTTVTVDSDAPVSLIDGYNAKITEIELQGQVEAYRVRVAPSVEELADA